MQGEQIDGTNYYYAKDHLGSIREMTDGSGTIHARYGYDPYGRLTKVQGDLDSDFTYAGYYNHSPSGLFATLNRFYNPDLGRWISRDPIGEMGGSNLYAYVANSPTCAIDPFGLDSWYNALIDWFFERGSTGGSRSNPRNYDASHQITRDLMRDEGVQQARDAWNAAGNPATFDYDYSFGVNDYLRELLTLDGAGSFLGSYHVKITPCPDGSTRYDITNTTGWESGTRSPFKGARGNPSVEDMFNGAPFTLNPRSIVNDRTRSDPGPGGNFYERFYWTE